MLCIKNARVATALFKRRPCYALRSSRLPTSSPIATPTRWPVPTRVAAFSTAANIPDNGNNLFEYTSGRWIYNEALRLEERKRVFNIDGLRKLAAEAVKRSPDDIIDLQKLDEDWFNRNILITMRDGFKMVAGIPLPVGVPLYLTTASEAATMDLLYCKGVPVPKVYGYSPSPDNVAGTEYIFTEYVQGTPLSEIWKDLGEEDIISITRQLAEIEFKMMTLQFPAGGSLYYKKDLKNIPGPVVPLSADGFTHFCVGPDTRMILWSGKRSELNIDRGPYKTSEEAFVKGAEIQRAYLEKFGQPLHPFQRVIRSLYGYQEQQPSEYIKILDLYLRIAPYIIPDFKQLTEHFAIRHPNLHPENVIVDSNLNITSLINWQQTPIQPLFLLAGIPDWIQNLNDPVSQDMTKPVLPEDFNNLDECNQDEEMKKFHHRLGHYHYVKNTEKHNIFLYAALTQHMAIFRNHLFFQASIPWLADPIPLKAALIEATEKWDVLAEGGAPCPITFDAKDVCATKKLDEEYQELNGLQKWFKAFLSLGSEGWVAIENYEEAMVRSEEFRRVDLEDAKSEEERVQSEMHWPWDDMDESEYL